MFTTRNQVALAEKRILLSEHKMKSMHSKILYELYQLDLQIYKNTNEFINDTFIVKDGEEDIILDINNTISKVVQQVDKTKIKYEKIFKQRDLIKYLENNGFCYKRHGRHANYSNGILTIPIPLHGSKDINFVIQRKIQKQIIDNN